ncbi:MAG: glycosyltransferase family 4 protein [Kiritimatiellaceae bacterium]|nr:glycosyltransferase family 4 protein [Kiritimatiellaceae bacterium]
MKILTIIQCSNLGGMEQATLESLSLLKGEGHDIELFSLHPAGELKPLSDERGIPLSGTEKYRFMGIGNILDILREIKRTRPDRIWLIGHNVGTLLAVRMIRCPAFLSIHYHHAERAMRFWRLFYAIARSSVRRIHFVSHYIYHEVEGLFGPKDDTVCFPNVFPEPQGLMGRADARAQLGISPNAYVVGNAGWLIKRKAFDVFLDTAALIKQKIPSAVFLIAGDGEEHEALRAQADRLGLGDAVIFLGWQRDLLPFYSSLDLLLFNSNFDALGRTPVEAMTFGIPVVASVLHGGLNEFIRHGVDGFLIDQHDPALLADEVLKLFESPDYKQRMVASGWNRVKDVGSPERHLKQLNNFLEL